MNIYGLVRFETSILTATNLESGPGGSSTLQRHPTTTLSTCQALFHLIWSKVLRLFISML